MNVQTHLQHNSRTESNTGSPVSKTERVSNVPPVLSSGEQGVQSALFLGYFDNLVQMYNLPGQTTAVKASIQSIMQSKLLQFSSWGINSGNQPLSSLYNKIWDQVMNSGPDFSANMKACAALEPQDRSTALSYLASSQFRFDNQNNNPATLMLLTQFMGSLNNNPQDPNYANYTNILESFMGQSDGAPCSGYLEEYSSSYLQSSERDTALFPIGGSDDPQGFKFFAATFSPPTDADSNYSDFCHDIQSHLSDAPVESPEQLMNEMGTNQWLSPSIWTPAPPSEAKEQSQSIESLEFNSLMNIKTDASNDGSSISLIPEDASLRI